MDKLNGIMNELNDMANFKGFGESEEEILNADGSRNWQANILLDNVKRLEQENEKLKEEIEIRDNLAEKFRKEALSWANIANGYQKDKTKLKQTLQEIKAIVCGNYEIIDPQGRNDILKLITKAESEG